MSRPTESYTTGTFAPEVSSFTFAGSSRMLPPSRTTGWVQPACRASWALAAFPTVPMTVAPR